MSESSGKQAEQGAVSEDAASLARLRAEKAALERRVAELEAAQTTAQLARAATLNVMEDVVAARRRAEEATEALRKSEEQQRLILESAKDYAIFTTDPDRRVTSWNAGACAICGYTEAEIMGQMADVVFVPEDRAQGAPEQEARRAAEEGRAENERWHLRKDGSRFYGSGLVRPLRDGRGGTVGFVKVMRDLTAQKQAEETQRRLDERQTFLLKLADALRPLADPAEARRAACAVLSENLGADCALFGEIGLDGQAVVISCHCVSEGSPPPAVLPLLNGFGRASPLLRRGEPLVLTNAAELEEPERASFQAAGVAATVTVPLVKSGRWMAYLSVQHGTPRAWSAHEIALVQETADRTWAAVERAQAEAAVHASELRLQHMVNVPGVGVLTFDAAGTLLNANDAFLSMVGYSRAEFAARTFVWQDFTPPDHLEESYRQLENMRATGRLGPYEKEYFRQDGSRIWLMFVAADLGDGTVVEYAVDVSDRKRAEAAVRESEMRLRVLADAVPQLIWANRGDGVANYFNRRWYEYSGLTFEESFGRGWEAIVHPEDAPASQERWRRAQAAGEIFDSEYRLRDARQEYRWFIGRNVPMHNAAGQVTGWFGTATDIHAQKEAEGIIREREERLRLLVENLPGSAAFIVDRQLRYLFAGGDALAAVALRPEDFIGRRVQDGVDPELAEVQEANYRLALQGQSFAHEHHSHGRYYSTRGVPLRLAGGKVYAVLAVSYDITDRKAAEEAMRESEGRVRIAVESARMGTWEWDLQEHEVIWNDFHFNLLGMKPRPNPLPDSAFFEHVHPEDRGWLTASIQQSIANQAAFEARFRIVTDQGEERWMNGYGKVTKERNGQAQQMSGVMFDITEQRHAEAALREGEERLRLVLESARDFAIFTLDAGGTVMSWNPGAQAIFGYTAEEIIGRSGMRMCAPEDRASGRLLQEIAIAEREGRAIDERWHCRQDGTLFWGSGSLVPLRGSAAQPGPAFLMILSDQTVAREAREAVEESKEQLWLALQETERARAAAQAAGEAKDHFLAVLSHELRTPLTPVLMAVRLLNRDRTLSPAARESLGMIERNIRLESRFIDDLLDLTRIERGKLEITLLPLHLHDVLRHSVEVAMPDLLAKNQRLEIALEAENDFLLGDTARLQQVFWNLLKNGSKFSPAETAICLRSRNPAALDGAASSIVVEVVDKGIGFEAEATERIFGAFTQASRDITREFGGLGLGLSISQASILAHGGTIRAFSPGHNQGATFAVNLNLLGPEATG